MKPKILTVDDDNTCRLVVKTALCPFECEVLEAANGMQGLELAIRDRPDLILLDCEMPVMNGEEMLTSLKADSALRSIPIIMLTAESARTNVLSIIKLGVQGYLVKPFKTEALLERVGQLLELRPVQPSALKIMRFDDLLKILVVDDKPAILERVKAGLAGTPWTMHGAMDANEAVNSCARILPHIILISLSLPGDSAFTLFQRFRADPRTKDTPILALSVKMTPEEEARTKEWGFIDIIAKPIDPNNLQLKIMELLNLDTSRKYFQHRDNLLVLLLPANLDQLAVDDISVHLILQIREAVNAGLNGLVIDLSQLKAVDTLLIKLGAQVAPICAELQLPFVLAGSEALCLECQNHPEAKDWRFCRSCEQAATLLSDPPPA